MFRDSVVVVLVRLERPGSWGIRLKPSAIKSPSPAAEAALSAAAGGSMDSMGKMKIDSPGLLAGLLPPHYYCCTVSPQHLLLLQLPFYLVTWQSGGDIQSIGAVVPCTYVVVAPYGVRAALAIMLPHTQKRENS